MTEVNFKALLQDAGIPTDEEALIARYRQVAVQEGVVFNNEPQWSPFWRIVLVLFARPLLWLIEQLYSDIYPGQFLLTASGAWVDMHAYKLGLERKRATKARGEIQLERDSTEGELTVPAGTVIQSAPINGVRYRLLTIDERTFVAGQQQLSVLADAEESGSAYNLAAGFYSLIATEMAGITAVRNDPDWLLVPGTDDETDQELKERCRNQFSAVNNWHVDAAYKAMLSQWPGVGIEDIHLQHNAPRGPGTANAYILFEQNAPADEYIAEMQQHIMPDGHHGLGDDVLVQPMPSKEIRVGLALKLNPNLSDNERDYWLGEIRSFIRIALRDLPADTYQPTRQQPQTEFVWSRLIQELHEQFQHLRSVDFDDDNNLNLGMAVPNLVELEIRA